MKNDYDRNVTLLCPTCASDELVCLDQSETVHSQYQCRSCEAEFSYADIRDSNSERIEAAVEEMKAEIVSDIKKDIAKMFKN
ncbi:ECs_2282 family putative zinc-binding protein [Shimia sp. W99]